MQAGSSLDYRNIIESFKAKQLSDREIEQRLSDLMLLFDFSSSLNRSGNLQETANLLLLTLMGYTAARRSVFLLCSKEGMELVAWKGFRSNPTILKFTCPLHPPFREAYQVDSSADLELKELFDTLGVQIIVPLHQDDKLLGLIGLGGKSGNKRESHHELQMVASLVQMCTNSVKNAEIHKMLESLNRQLILRVYQLNTLFELSKDFNAVWDAQTIFRILGNSLTGQLLLSRCAVFTTSDDGLDLQFCRGFRFTQDDLKTINHKNLRKNFPDKTPNTISDLTPGPFHEFLSEHKVHLIFPMIMNDEVRGWILLGDRKTRKGYAQEDYDFITTLSSLALVSDENARMQQQMIEKQRMEKELSIAREIQFSLLPQSIPNISTYGIATAFQPAYQVGGDYFDFIPVSDSELALAIGDVSGKSTPAAMIMASLQASLRALASMQISDPVLTIQRINKLLVRSHGKSNKYVTFFYGILNHQTHELVYVNAGHCYPLIVKKKGKVDRLETGGMVMGFFDEVPYKLGRYSLEPDDLMILYTDGVSELVDSDGEEYGTDRIIQVLKDNHGESVSEIRDQLVKNLTLYRGDENQFDDLTLILLKRIE
ncbi:PP2C family protein-serine/threonine phosphatase [bacterium]|nr:PP2C family protein-serine/threonine phosphatase [bacterium]